jgi:hypothetical protein
MKVGGWRTPSLVGRRPSSVESALNSSHRLSSDNMQGNTTLVHGHYPFYDDLIQVRSMDVS